MSITFDSDEHIERFRVESDKAFLAMQASCDRAMESFLRSHGEDTSIISFQTPEMGWGQAPASGVQSVMGAVRRKVKQAASAAEKVASRKARAASGTGSAQNFDSFAELGDAVKNDLSAEGKEAVVEAKGWLRSAGMDLGERAKREAAAMREAARKAMEEETSLRGLKDRAKQELEAAKQRMKAELLDAASDARQDLEGLAIDKLGEAQEHGFAAAEAAHRQAKKELGGIWDVPDVR